MAIANESRLVMAVESLLLATNRLTQIMAANLEKRIGVEDRLASLNELTELQRIRDDLQRANLHIGEIS